MDDVSLQQQLNMTIRSLRAISGCSEIVIHGESEQEILQKVCEKIIETTGYKFVWVGYVDTNVEKTVTPVAKAGLDGGYLDSIKVTWGDDAYGQGPTGKSIRTKTPAVMQNMATNPEFAPWRNEALKRGYASSLCLPLIIDENVIGSLCIYSSSPDSFTDDEIQLFSELSENVSHGIAALRVRQERQKLAQQLQTILESVSDGVFTLNHDYKYTYINDQAAAMVGKKSAEDLLGKNLWEEFPEAKNTKYYQLYHDAMDSKKVMRFEEYYPPFYKWYAGTIYPSPDGISVFFQDVTERKTADEKVRKSEKELIEAQRIGHIGSWDWDAKTDKITWSREYYYIFGIDPQVAPPGYQDHLRIYAAESAKRLDSAVQKAMQTGEPYVLDLEFTRSDGTKGWIIARGEVKRDANNAIVGLRGTAQDITERKLAEEKIHTASLYNRNLIETSLDPMITIDDTGKITDVNKAFEEATGVERAKLIETDIAQYFTDPEKVREGLHRTLREGLIRDYRVAIKNATTGHILDCVWNTVVYKDEKGNVQGVFAAARDISQLEKVQAALKESEERYRSYIENSSDIIYALDAMGKFSYISPQCRQLDLTPEELVGKKTIADILPQESKEEVLREFGRSQRGEKKKVQTTFLFKDKENHIFWLEAVGTVQFDDNGKFAGEVGIVRDVTDRKTAEDKLKELDTIKSRFIRVVSHQLRTPLSAIRWQLESLLAEHDHLSELQKQLIQESYRADLEIIASINDLLTALDIEEGRSAYLDRMPNSLFSLWQSVAMEFTPKCQAKQITCLTVSPEAEVPLVDMDGERIRTVMEKLASNSLAYTKEGGRIMVRIDKTDSTVRFVITDTGVGIPKIEQKYIFQRFYRASNASLMKPDASGLGLYIAKHFIESHGGGIGFFSEEGKGSTFWFDIPLQREVLH